MGHIAFALRNISFEIKRLSQTNMVLVWDFVESVKWNSLNVVWLVRYNKLAIILCMTLTRPVVEICSSVDIIDWAKLKLNKLTNLSGLSINKLFKKFLLSEMVFRASWNSRNLPKASYSFLFLQIDRFIHLTIYVCVGL